MGAARGQRWPIVAVGGLLSPVSPDRTFKRARKRESAGRAASYRTDAASIARPSMANEPTSTGLRAIEQEDLCGSVGLPPSKQNKACGFFFDLKT